MDCSCARHHDTSERREDAQARVMDVVLEAPTEYLGTEVGLGVRVRRRPKADSTPVVAFPLPAPHEDLSSSRLWDACPSLCPLPRWLHRRPDRDRENRVHVDREVDSDNRPWSQALDSELAQRRAWAEDIPEQNPYPLIRKKVGAESDSLANRRRRQGRTTYPRPPRGPTPTLARRGIRMLFSLRRGRLPATCSG